MTIINPGQGPLQPSRTLGAKVEAEVKEVASEAIAGLKAAADGVAASLSKLSDQLAALEGSKGGLRGPDLDAIRDYLRGQEGAGGRAWNPADIAPMYGAPWKPPIDGGGWNPIAVDPADIAPMYGAPWRPPVDGGDDGPVIDPADIAPMYGAPWRPPVDDGGDGPVIDPADIAPMYGASFPRPLPGGWGEDLKPIVGVIKLQDA